MKKLFLIFLLFISIISEAQPPVANFSANQTSGCGTLVVSFTDLSTNIPTGWFWEFGDGQTALVKNPIHSYNNPGTYTVKLTATNNNGSNTITKTAYIHVYHLPSPDFTANPLVGCVPLNVHFTNTTTLGDAAITTWLWDFGDGSNSNQQNPSHTYNTAGSFQVTLSVTDGNSCSSNKVKANYIVTGNKPNANFTSNYSYTCNPPVNVQFTNTTTPPGCSFVWNFGDGGTSTQTSPSHNYNSAGSYNVQVIANQNGCADTTMHTVNVQTHPFIANFIANPISGCTPLDVSFTDQSSSSANSWEWTFGDGGTSNIQNPNHTYSSAGTYTVRLISSNANGCSDTLILTNYVHVYNPPTINFTANNTFACHPPLNVNFTSAAPGAVSWQWNFGDSTSGTGQNPSHTYTNEGYFDVTLTIVDNHGCTVTLTKPDYIIVSPPLPHIIASPHSGCKPLPVNFTDSTVSVNPITGWSWNFGDGTPVSNLHNPNHNYPDTGLFIVTLTVSDQTGCSNTVTDTVGVGQHPFVNFGADTLYGCHKFTVHFYDSSSSFVNQWHWDFGDHATSDLQNPVHTYADTGYFDVTLVAYHNGCADSMKKLDYIYVKPPKPIYNATPTISCSYPVTVQFNDQSIGAQTYLWSFGDGTTSTQVNPSHTYNNPGLYDVKLVVYNASYGCRDSLLVDDMIKISEIIPNYIQVFSSTCVYDPSIFICNTYTNTNQTAWHWDFGDGYIGNGFSVTHYYDTVGIFSVELVVTDALGCKDSITKANTITILPLPSPNFTTNHSSGCLPFTVNFTDISNPQPPANSVSWHWDFGDGDTSNIKNPTHTYTAPGYYNVSLSITNSNGCDSTIIKDSLIYITVDTAAFICDTVVCSGTPISFTNNSIGVSLHYSWNFGDGSPISTLKNPSHIYNVDSTTFFTVILNISDTNGCTSSSQKQIKVSKPVANFTSNTMFASCPPLFANFNDSSSLDVTTWYWTFGDTASGTNNHSGIENPQHYYSASGTYDLTLLVTNADGCEDTIVKNDFIVINGPTGSFDYNPKNGCAPVDVDFVAITQSTTGYLWVFADGGGTTTNTGNTSHTYINGGFYVPTLVLQDSLNNCSLTLFGEDTIKIINAFPNFGYSSFIPCTDSATIHFSDSSTSNLPISSWLWEFGDGTSSNLQNPSHFYNQSGTYDVKLTITIDSCTFSITKPDVVTIFIAPQITFSISGTSTCTPPLSVNFTVDDASITYPVNTWDWDFGDGTAHSAQKNPSHSYSNTGNYSVVLTVTFQNGCQKTFTNSYYLQVYSFPTAGFSPDTNNVLTYDPITFTNTSSGTDLSYSWNFGDGSGSTDINPTYYYLLAGFFDVTLIASTPNGCSDTATFKIHILEDIIIPNVFTPNGDGFNDKFEIISSGFPDYNLEIFNRWGNIVFRTTNPRDFWDGTVKGEPAAAGTYYYTIAVKNKVKNLKFNGSITLIR